MIAEFGASETVADAEGVFRFSGVAPVAYAITAQILDTRGPLPRVTAVGHAEPVHPSAPPIDIVLARLLPIHGIVVDSAGRPLAEVGIEVTGSAALLPFVPRIESLSADDGSFEVWAPEGATVDLRGVRQSSFMDVVTKYGPTSMRTGVQSGSEGVVLSMPDDR
jgi:hypothetical protein